MGKANINYIKHRGTVQEATLFDGTKVYRQDRIFGGDKWGLVKTASYDNHFVYNPPVEHRGAGMMCTCGGMAVVVGANDYAGLGTPTSSLESSIPGTLVVCHSYLDSYKTSGIPKHADGSS